MKAVRITELGKPVADAEMPEPETGEGEVLVRIKAAGVCHSDEHYRSGTAPPAYLPITPGHEVAGVIEEVGAGVPAERVGQRVALHYLITCGRCLACKKGDEQFCTETVMIGKYADGGWAEYISVPSINAVPITADIPFAAGAVMMCSTSTSYHALKKSRLASGERVAIFGAGGLGQSAVQLAFIMGASEVFAVDINQQRLDRAAAYGATPIHAGNVDPVAAVHESTGGRGVDVSLELIGLTGTIEQAVASLGPKGRACIAGICPSPISINTYTSLVGKEAEIIGVSDHLLSELYELVALSDRLSYSDIITETIPLSAADINKALTRLSHHGGGVRTVIVP